MLGELSARGRADEADRFVAVRFRRWRHDAAVRESLRCRTRAGRQAVHPQDSGGGIRVRRAAGDAAVRLPPFGPALRGQEHSQRTGADLRPSELHHRGRGGGEYEVRVRRIRVSGREDDQLPEPDAAKRILPICQDAVRAGDDRGRGCGGGNVHHRARRGDASPRRFVIRIPACQHVRQPVLAGWTPGQVRVVHVRRPRMRRPRQ